MDPFFLSKLLTNRLNNCTMENNKTTKEDDKEVLSPVVENKKTVQKEVKKAPKEDVKKAEEKAAKEAEAERIRLRNLGYI